MISPDTYVSQFKNRTLKQCIEERDELIRELKEFETDPQYEGMMLPSPLTQYNVTVKYLKALCDLIAEKVNQADPHYEPEILSTIEIRKAGITNTGAECVVNAANSYLQEGGGVCDMNPTASLKREDLENGEMLREAILRFSNERNEDNFFDVLELLRDSIVCVPCSAILSDQDQKAMEQLIKDAENDPDSLKGVEITSKDQIRLVPDILQNGDDFFFPVFSSAEEMGEYGQHFSCVETEFLHAIRLARNNEKKLKGIVVNAFSIPFILDAELFDVVEKTKTRIVQD